MKPSFKHANWKSSHAGAFLFALLCAVLATNNATRAATTNFNWIATSPADYSVASDWDQGFVPGSSMPGFNYVALFTNNVICNYYSNSAAVLDTNWIGQISLGPWNNSAGSLVMNGGILLVSNAQNDYAVTIGGRSGTGGSGAASLAPSSGTGSVGNFTMTGGTLTISRYGSGYYHQDSFILGLATNSTGTFTLNGGTANFLCGVELGIYGAGIVNVNGGALVDNGWFGVGRGNSVQYGSGTFNLNGGVMYLLPNYSGGTTANNGGIYFNQGATNATVNVSGGSLYTYEIGFAGNGYTPPAQDTLNISGGSLCYWVQRHLCQQQCPTGVHKHLPAGRFIPLTCWALGFRVALPVQPTRIFFFDGTNWVWYSGSVNLTNSSFLVNGVGGPGYVTFAPEASRIIILENVWSGVGGFVVNGPGAVAMTASNNYTGNTTISQGVLAVAAGGSIANSANIIVAAAGTFEGPGAGSAYALGAGQTLSNSGSTATLGGDINTGSGTVALNYTSGTPAFTVISGALGLSSSTALEINNTGATLAPGNYQIISTGSGGSITVPGGLPTVTVGGGGVAAGKYTFLNVTANGLYLEVTTNRPPVIASTVTNTFYYGLPWQIAITNLANLAGWSDPNNEPLGLSSVGPLSGNGTNVTTDGTNIYYNGLLTSDDYFYYTITDATASAMGVVQLDDIVPTAAIPADAGDSMSLDGTWRFYFEHTNYNFGTPPNVVLPAATQPFQQLNYVEVPAWTNLPVPGNWEMYGFSPCTYYVGDDTCGLYRHWFQIPQSWQGRRVYLYFGGVLDGAEVWLNGQPVPVNEPIWNINNYHESGWTGFQVDLTSAANFGTSNLLAVRVIKQTPSNDLDTGDYFFLGGIDRPVTLYSVPQTNIADVQVSTFVTNNVATVDVTADVNGGDAPVSMFLNGVETDTTSTNGTAIFSQTINQPNLWSAEFPNLYYLVLELKNTNGQVAETYTNHIGIRQLTITNGVLLLNGVPVKFAGVGDHDSNPTNGSAVGPDFWYNELKLMKAANINAIRTTHYPFDSSLYEAADELGVYVSDELPYCWCDPETPASNFTPAFTQRAQEAIRRDRNHPSIVIWAIGNENTAGNNLQVVANLVHSLDPTRPRLVSTFNASQYGTELSDAHYPSIATMQSDAANAASTGHPFIFLEQPNTMDERLGADAGMWEDWGITMQRVWNVCIASNTIPGTFPFEWSDRAVQDPNSNASYAADGAQLLYYFPATGIHLLKMKGMVDSFRNERPNVYELKMIYSPVQIVSNSLAVSSGQASFSVQNRYSFTDLSYLTTQWQLERNGVTIASGTTNLEMPPLTSGNVQLALPANALSYADTLRLDFIHPNGNDVYPYQFTLVNVSPASVMNTNLPPALPIPAFNLIVQTNYSDPLLWTESIRFPSTLTNVTLTPANATTLAQLSTLSGTVIGGTNGMQVLGTVQAQFTNNIFSYTMHWTGATWPVQEVGWTFQMPGNYTNFSWNRNARWTAYPSSDIGRASGTATPASTNNVDATDMNVTNAFDFNSTKYNCYWASLTSAAGDGIMLQFNQQQLFECRAGGTTNGVGWLLYANQQVSPPNDFANIVPDLFLTMSSGKTLQGSFSVGANSNIVSAAAGTLNGHINALVTTGQGANSGTQVELNFGGSTNASYSVWSSTNLVNWIWEGAATQANPGQFEFSDPTSTNFPARFYRITSP